MATNRYKIFEEDRIEDLVNDNTIVWSIVQDIRLEEVTTKYNKVIKESNKVTEYYNIEIMTSQALQAFLIEEYQKNKQAQEILMIKQEQLEVEQKYAESMQTLACQNYANQIKEGEEISELNLINKYHDTILKEFFCKIYVKKLSIDYL